MSERVTHEQLMRYLDGEVGPEERSRIEASVENSTELRRELAVYRAMKDDLQSGTYTWERVAVDGKLITSQGPATALDFALTLIAKIEGPEKASEVSGPMLVR